MAMFAISSMHLKRYLCNMINIQAPIHVPSNTTMVRSSFRKTILRFSVRERGGAFLPDILHENFLQCAV